MASLVYYKNKKNGDTYVYENISTWNKETQRCDTKRKYLGKLDSKSGEILPTSRVDKDGAEKAYADVRCEGTAPLLDRLSKNLSLTRILQETFPEEWSKILTCAYYLINEGKALSHVETWSMCNAHPYREGLASQRISELLQNITKSKQVAFFKKWAEIRAESEYMALDISSVSSYGKQNEYVRYGYNRDNESLPQINLCLLLGEESGIPIYFETLNGSIKDVSALENVLKMMSWLKPSRLHVVMDRGFYSEHNIDNLYDKHIRFTVGVPFTTKWTQQFVANAKDNIEDYAHFRRLGDYTFFADTDTTVWKGHRCYRHIYYDSKKASAEYANFLEKIEQWRTELEQKKTVETHQQYYDRYFVVKDTPKRGRRIMVRDEEVQSFKQKTAGFFVLISNDIKDPVQALKIYRDKDIVEKGFDNLKNALDMNRLRIHSAGAMQGRLFIQFVAQILMSAIHNGLVSAKLDEKYTLPEMVNELKSIHRVRLEDRLKPLYTKLSKSQNELTAAFGFDNDSYV